MEEKPRVLRPTSLLIDDADGSVTGYHLGERNFGRPLIAGGLTIHAGGFLWLPPKWMIFLRDNPIKKIG